LKAGVESPLIIGWAEYVALPEWGIAGLRAKVDTGARSSALHVERIEPLPDRQVAFDVVLRRRGKRVRVTAPIVREGRVRSSSGESSTRLFVETLLRLGDHEKRIEISLVDRAPMIHRMLLGRSALTGAILIDVDARYRLGRPERTSKRKRPPRHG
jgi:ribosomal protein S6--L-glutamate ligase